MNNLQVSTSQAVALSAVAQRQYVVTSLDGEGMFSMNARPAFHTSGVSATREAARLAALYPGKAFVVMQLAGGSMVPSAPAIRAL